MDYNVLSTHMGEANPVFVFPTKDLAELAAEHGIEVTEEDIFH
jgi:hypothetical protein